MSWSSYVQRAGRAGRRAGITPFVLTFCRALPHDQYYFKTINSLVSGIVDPPAIVLENEKILQRHLKAVVLSKFLDEYRIIFSRSGNDRHIKDPNCYDLFENNISFEDTENNRAIMLEPVRYLCDIWYEKHKNNLITDFTETFYNCFTQNEQFFRNCVDSFDEKLTKDERYGLEGAALRDYNDSISFYENQRNNYDPAKKEERKNYDYFDSMLKQTREDKLISYLSVRGVLPSYAFPTDVVPLQILADNAGARLLDLNRELGRAISEYAPGSTVVANARVYTPGALYKYPNRQFKIYYYKFCPQCHWFRYTENKQELHLKTICDCGMPLPDVPCKAILPELGFSVPRDSDVVPIRKNTKLAKAGYASELYMDEDAFPKKDPYLIKLKNGELIMEYANGYKMVRINRGLKDQFGKQGFTICKECGRAFESKKQIQKKHLTPYLHNCISPNIIDATHLISFFDTDALRITFSSCPTVPDDVRNTQYTKRSFWRTVLYSFIESLSANFCIDRDDLDGIFLSTGISNFSRLILIDAVSGGAGHVARLIGKDGSDIEKNVQTLIHGAVEILSCRDCAEDSACYSCLYHSSNQKVQHTLNRGLAKKWLEMLLL